MRYRDEICLNDLQSSIVNFDIRLKIVALEAFELWKNYKRIKSENNNNDNNKSILRKCKRKVRALPVLLKRQIKTSMPGIWKIEQICLKDLHYFW